MSDQPKSSVTRRAFAAAIGGAGVPALVAQQAPSPAKPAQPSGQQSGNPTPGMRPGTLPETPPFGPEIEFSRKPAALKVKPFPMAQVRLLPGIYQQSQQWNYAYMQRLPADRLLHNFRLNAGFQSTAEPFGGWEMYVPPRTDGTRPNSDGELRGHFTGHYLSACALHYASTGDREIKAKGDLMVDELAKCQQKLGAGGYLSAFPTEWFDRLSARRPVWAPYYTIHKIMAGMLDMYELAGNKQALQVLEGMSSWADEWTASKTEEHMQNILNTEFGGMNEVLYNLAAATGNDRWARAGDRFTKKRYFNPLALRRDEMRGLHVNTHIPLVIGAAARYDLSSDTRFRDVADFYWWTVLNGRTYVTGGTSNGEGWLAQPRALAAELKRYASTGECCCAYNMLKLARRMYTWTADPDYFDYYERTLINHRIGTILPEKGYTQYYLSLMPGAWKTFNTEDRSFWCCTGSGVEEFAKLNDSIYWQDARGLFVNLFVPSELNWTEKGFKLRQDTKFPEQASTMLTVTANRPVQLTVRLRVPGWMESAPTVKVNGKPLDASAGPGGYLSINRTWRTGDRIEMELPMRLHIEAMPDDPKTQAILYGPVVLAGDLGSEGLTERNLIGPNSPSPQRIPLEIPTFKASGDVASWVKPGAKPLEFRTTGQAKDVTLLPLNSIYGKRYSVYWQTG